MVNIGYGYCSAVLQILDVYPGSASKNLSIFNPNNVSSSQKMIWDVLSDFFPSRIRIPDPGVKKPSDRYVWSWTGFCKIKADTVVELFIKFWNLILLGAEGSFGEKAEWRHSWQRPHSREATKKIGGCTQPSQEVITMHDLNLIRKRKGINQFV